MIRQLVCFVCLLMLILAPLRALGETAGADSPSTGSAAAPAKRSDSPTALEYLKRLEEKNKDVKTMAGSFQQTRISEVVLEKSVYTGHFTYEKPNRFRLDYTGKDGKRDESTVLMLADEVWDYVPSIEQVTRTRLDSRAGQQREINQFLLGFGVKAEKALEYFDVSLGDPDATGKTFSLVFRAKNPDETMQFVKATITFDGKSLLPQTIHLIDSIGDRTEIELGEVKFNTSIKASLFEPKWPEGTVLIEQ